MTDSNSSTKVQTGTIQTLAQKIEAILLTLPDDDDKAVVLHTAGVDLLRRFERLGHLADSEQAIDFLRQAVELTPDGDSDKPGSLMTLGSAFQSRFVFLAEPADIDQAIYFKQQAVDLTPDGHDDKPGWLANLGNAFQRRFERLGKPTDIEQAIVSKQQAVDLTPDGHDEKPGWLNNLGTAFQKRFDHFGDPADIKRAIYFKQQAVDLTPDGHEDKPRWFNNLGTAFQSRFERFGQIADIDQAVHLKQQAVNLTPDGHIEKLEWLNNLGNAFTERFDKLGRLADIEEAIVVLQQAVNLTPEGHAQKPYRLNHLGNAFHLRFGHLGELADLEQAIDSLQQGLKLTPDDHAKKPYWLNNLGTAFNSRFYRLGELTDIKQAIINLQQAVDLTPDGHAHRPTRLINLGTAFQLQFDHLGELADIEQAISVLQQAVELTPDSHADKPAFLTTLGSAFQSRFRHLEELMDINQAIVSLQQAIDLTPDGHADKPRQLDDLGTAFQLRFYKLRERSDIDKAIDLLQQAVDLTPDSHAGRSARLLNLGNAFHSRFEHLDGLTDIDQAIYFKQQAVDLTPDGHANKPSMLGSLGKAFQCQFEHLGNLTDVDQAIDLSQQAVDLTPDNHADKPGFLMALGKSFRSRYHHLNDLSDHCKATSAFQTASVSLSGHPFEKLQAAKLWADLCLDPWLALQAYEQMFRLIPRSSWLGQTVSRRIEQVPPVGHATNAAVATAISIGKYSKAIEWFEDGHSVVWGQLSQLRLPLDSLRDKHPQIAEYLEIVSRALEITSISVRPNDSNLVPNFLEREAQRHTKLAGAYESILKEIRKLDGFKDFLMQSKLSELASAAKHGHVIIVNIANSRCDAIVLLPPDSDIIHVPLPNISLKQCQVLHSKMILSLRTMNVRIGRNGDRLKVKTPGTIPKNSGTAEFQSVLTELWLNVVQPILYKLGLLNKPKDPLPHITWCATGALAFLPLHAAGIYGSADLEQNVKISDYVVSSYTTTLTAMINSNSIPKRDPTQKPKILIVSQPKTPGMPSLPGALEEAQEIKNCLSQECAITHLSHDNATVDTVTEQMGDYEIVHFACHGVQDLEDPLYSSFSLYDGELTLRLLMTLSFDNAELAILSACQTATGDARLSEEAVHLAAVMLAVGYPSVIATMWSIEDKDVHDSGSSPGTCRYDPWEYLPVFWPASPGTCFPRVQPGHRSQFWNYL